jgi:hypothetical protein
LRAHWIFAALAPLAVDGALGVRVQAVACYGAVASRTSDASVAQRVATALDALLDAGNPAVTLAAIRAIGTAAPACAAPSFAEWAIGCVLNLAKTNTQSSLLQLGEAGLRRRRTAASALFDAVQVR